MSLRASSSRLPLSPPRALQQHFLIQHQKRLERQPSGLKELSGRLGVLGAVWGKREALGRGGGAPLRRWEEPCDLGGAGRTEKEKSQTLRCLRMLRPMKSFLKLLSLLQRKREEEEARSSLLLPGHLRGVPRSGPDEGLEGSTLRVDAQRHSFSLLVLRDEAMD